MVAWVEPQVEVNGPFRQVCESIVAINVMLWMGIASSKPIIGPS